MVESDSICPRCADIDLDQIFRGGYETPHRVRDLGSVPRDQLISSCPLCRLIAEALYRPFGNASLDNFHEHCGYCDVAPSERKQYHLFAVAADGEKRSDSIRHTRAAYYLGHNLQIDHYHVHDEAGFSKLRNSSLSTTRSPATDKSSFVVLKVGWIESFDSNFIAFYGSIYPAFGVNGGPAPARKLSSTSVDWRILRSFVTSCRDTHEECNLPRTQPDVEGFRFLDCTTRCLVSATAGQDYVALSYVWGNSDKMAQDDNLELGMEVSEMPLVIEDAMRVVVEMGYKYLWVDRYCIDQSSQSSIEDHLSKMNLIYENATFTIVAAAGEDSAFGLPGVSKMAREPQASAILSGQQLVSAIEPFRTDSESKWNSRAWTYQEGLFSTRQLIFGPNQVSLHCIKGEQCEVFTSPFARYAGSAPCNKARTRSVWEHIELCSKRDLTCDSDAINALTATIQAFNDDPGEPVAQLWGIPFSRSLTPLDHIQESGRERYAGSSPTGLLSKSIFASETALFGYGLAWQLSGSTPGERATLRRRKDFPTWSWASCTGYIKFQRMPFLAGEGAVMPDPELDLHIESVDGLLIPIADYLAGSDHPRPSRYLHVEGWSVRDALTVHLSEDGVFASLDLGDPKYEMIGPVQLDSLPDENDHGRTAKVLSQRRNSRKRWEALVVWFSPKGENNAIKPFIILLTQADDPRHPGSHVFERVGHISQLTITRMPKKRRRAAVAKVNVPRGSRPTTKWATETIREMEERSAKIWKGFSNTAAIHDDNFVDSPVADPTKLDKEPVSAVAAVHDEQIGSNVTHTAMEDDDLSSGTDGDYSSLSEASSEDTDYSVTGDYTIDSVISRGRAERYFPRIPMVRRKFILR